jgi:hypothetical protein
MALSGGCNSQNWTVGLTAGLTGAATLLSFGSLRVVAHPVAINAKITAARLRWLGFMPTAIEKIIAKN